MLYLALKALLSGLVIAVASEVARRSPTFGALIVSLPLVSVLAMIWLWRDTGDGARIADFAFSTFWLLLPSMPMFLVLPWLLRQGIGFWGSLGLSLALTAALYWGMTVILARMGNPL